MSEKKYIVPPADIFENVDHYMIYLDMPGTAKESINIEVNDGILSIQGKVEKVGENYKSIINEFDLEDYHRDFKIGNRVDQEKIEAGYKDGVLKIKLEKAENLKPRKIEVKSQ